MKKFIYSIILAVSIFFFSACSAHYVVTQPNYTEVTRPPRPGNTHIWIDGNWRWNRQTRTYNQGNGYWTLPNNNRTYRHGKWNTNRRGYYWIPGKWR